MSYYGRLCVEHLADGEDALERLGGLLPWEATRIRRDGDYSPIIRRLEPAFSVGQRIVLSVSHQRAQVIRDAFGKPTGEIVPRLSQPLLTITIRTKRRRRKGDWAIGFDVFDRRDPASYVRRKPPALREGEYAAATDEEVAEAAIESAYTHNPKQALDRLERVPLAWQNVLVVQAKDRRAAHLAELRGDRDENETRENVKRASARLKAVTLAELRAGRDPMVLLGRLEQVMSEHEAQIRKAA